MIIDLQKSRKKEKQTFLGHLDLGFQNVGAKVDINIRRIDWIKYMVL